MSFMNRNRTYSVDTPFNYYIVQKSNSNNNKSNGAPGIYSKSYTGNKEFLRKINTSNDNITRHVTRVQSINTLSALAGIFVFITVVTTAILAIFCCKRNTVYAFPKSDPEDYEEFELEDIRNKAAANDTAAEGVNQSDQSFCEHSSSDEDSIGSTEPAVDITTRRGSVAESESLVTVYQSNSSWMLHSQASLVPRTTHSNNKLSSSSFQCGFTEIFTRSSRRKDWNTSEEEEEEEDNNEQRAVQINEREKITSPIRFLDKSKPSIQRYRSLTSELQPSNSSMTSYLLPSNSSMTSYVRLGKGSRKGLLCHSRSSSSVHSFTDINVEEMCGELARRSTSRKKGDGMKLQGSVSSLDILRRIEKNDNNRHELLTTEYVNLPVDNKNWKEERINWGVIKSSCNGSFGIESNINHGALECNEGISAEMSDFGSILQPLLPVTQKIA